MSLYQIEVRDQYGRLVTVLTQPISRQYTLYRNKPGSLQFTLSLYDLQATLQNLRLNQYDIVFRRNGTPIAYGQISYIEPHINTKSDEYEIDIIATGYFDLLSQRQVNPYFPNYDSVKNQLVFSAVDGGTVIDTLIQDTQFPVQADGNVLMQGSTPTICESFICPGGASALQIKLLLQAVGSPTGNLIIGIYPDNGADAPSANPVQFSVITTAVSTITSQAWYTFSYSAPLPILTNGTKYWIKTYLDTTQSGGNGINIAFLNGGYYGNGRAFSPENTGLFSAGQNLQFFILLDDNSYQMAKNTYLGFLKGTIQSSFNITRTYDKYKVLKDAIEEVTKTTNGVDFNIAVAIDSNNRMTKSYNVFYPRQGINNTMLPFVFPGNLKKITKPRDGKSMGNYINERGQGSTNKQPQTVSLDVTSIQTYGLREVTEDSSDVPDTGTLQFLGDELLRVRKDPLDVPKIALDGRVAPPLGSYGIGDTILITVATGNVNNVINISQTYRIEQIDVTITEDDQEEITLGLSIA